MTLIESNAQPSETVSASLCKACGLCCTGHLFINAELYPSEVERTKALGLNVLPPDPANNGFRLPCPLWKGQCTIYAHPHKPSICGDFKCKLLREVEAEQLPLDSALFLVKQAKQLIQELDEQMPVRQTDNFRKHLFEYVNRLERSRARTATEDAFRLKAGVLLVLFAQRFGVKGLFNTPEREKSAQE